MYSVLSVATHYFCSVGSPRMEGWSTKPPLPRRHFTQFLIFNIAFNWPYPCTGHSSLLSDLAAVDSKSMWQRLRTLLQAPLPSAIDLPQQRQRCALLFNGYTPSTLVSQASHISCGRSRWKGIFILSYASQGQIQLTCKTTYIPT